jgi:hypothetical protein
MYERLTSEEKRLVRIAKERPDLRDKIAKYIKKSSSETVVLFLEAVLGDSEKQKLLSWLGRQESTPSNWAGWEIIAHHMKVEFFGNKGRPKNIPKEYVNKIGETVGLEVVGIAMDEKAIAVLIKPPSSLAKLVKNEFPHITIAVDGVKPPYSNKLIKKSIERKTLITKDENGRNISFNITAKVGYFEGRTKADLFELPSELF